jgi:hypothetical protein
MSSPFHFHGESAFDGVGQINLRGAMHIDITFRRHPSPGGHSTIQFQKHSRPFLIAQGNNRLKFGVWEVWVLNLTDIVGQLLI